MAERDDKGRFVKGNQTSGKAGKARAAKLSPERRAAIARMGLEAVAAELGLTPDEAVHWLSERGRAARLRMLAARAEHSEGG